MSETKHQGLGAVGLQSPHNQSAAERNLASRNFNQPSRGTQILDTTILSIKTENADKLEISHGNFSLRNGHISGYFVLHVIQDIDLKNTPIIQFASGYITNIGKNVACYIQPSEWSTATESAKVGWINIYGHLICNWGITIEAGKYLTVLVDYDI